MTAAITTPVGVSDEDARSFARILAIHAEDAEDCWNLLEACGMVPYEHGEPDKPRAEKSPAIKYPRVGQ